MDYDTQANVSEGRLRSISKEKDGVPSQLEESACEREARKAKKFKYHFEYRKAHKEKIRAFQAEYRLTHKNEIKKNQAEYAAKHKEKRQAYHAAWRSQNKTSMKLYHANRYKRTASLVRATSMKWYKQNKDRALKTAETWRKRNVHKVHSYHQRRRALKKGASVGSQPQIIAWEKAWKSKRTVNCYWCNKTFKPVDCHSDHIVALINGGMHDVSNLCISCAKCNWSKGAKTIPEWNANLENPVLQL